MGQTAVSDNQSSSVTLNELAKKARKFGRNSFKRKEAPAESLFLFTFGISCDSKIFPTKPTLFLLLEYIADFGLRLYNLPFLFDLNKNISKTLTEVNICLKPFGKHCLKKKNKNIFIYTFALFT